MSDIYPKAIVFDLDYTFWPCWCDTHLTTPIKLSPYCTKERPRIIDATGYEVELYTEVIPILKLLKSKHVKIYTASRTATPQIAKKMLRLFQLDQLIDRSKWGFHSKVRHIEELVKENNINSADETLRYTDMCLFDDEWRNSDVEKELGVKFCHLKDEQLTWEEFTRGIREWRQQQEQQQTDSNSL